MKLIQIHGIPCEADGESVLLGRWKQPGGGVYLREDKVKLTPGSLMLGDAEINRWPVVLEGHTMEFGGKATEVLH